LGEGITDKFPDPDLRSSFNCVTDVSFFKGNHIVALLGCADRGRERHPNTVINKALKCVYIQTTLV
jgi:hypothetical protein